MLAHPSSVNKSFTIRNIENLLWKIICTQPKRLMVFRRLLPAQWDLCIIVYLGEPYRIMASPHGPSYYLKRYAGRASPKVESAIVYTYIYIYTVKLGQTLAIELHSSRNRFPLNHHSRSELPLHLWFLRWTLVTPYHRNGVAGQPTPKLQSDAA